MLIKYHPFSVPFPLTVSSPHIEKQKNESNSRIGHEDSNLIVSGILMIIVAIYSITSILCLVFNKERYMKRLFYAGDRVAQF